MSRVVPLIVIIVLLPVASVSAQTQVFRNLSWGEPPSTLGDTVLVSESGPLLTLERRHEDHRLGSVHAVVIRYGFYDDRLYQVTVGTLDGPQLEELVFLRYGTPTRSINGVYFWEVVDEDTLVTFGQDSGSAVMVLASMSLLDELVAWENAQKEAQARTAW